MTDSNGKIFKATLTYEQLLDLLDSRIKLLEFCLKEATEHKKEIKILFKHLKNKRANSSI